MCILQHWEESTDPVSSTYNYIALSCGRSEVNFCSQATGIKKGHWRGKCNMHITLAVLTAIRYMEANMC